MNYFDIVVFFGGSSGIANSTPLKRIAHPDEIADAIILVTLNKNITGSIIDIDGGSTL